MFVVLLDEVRLLVFASAEDAVRAIEAVDAERVLRAAFDAEAVPHGIEWIRPNPLATTPFGTVESVALGEYRFVPTGPADPEALIRLLEEYPEPPEPSGSEQDLVILLSELRGRVLADLRAVLQGDPTSRAAAGAYWSALQASGASTGSDVAEVFGPAAEQTLDGIADLVLAARELFDASGESPRARDLPARLTQRLRDRHTELEGAALYAARWLLAEIGAVPSRRP
jgi:hypothetical protein